MQALRFATVLSIGLSVVNACHGSGPSQSAELRSELPPVPPPLPPFQGTAYQAAASVPLEPTKPEEHPELHNLFQLSPEILSGSEPLGEEAFRILHEKGIRTILSVDGKVPDAELAGKYGMKYVHVPIQYKGISPHEMAKIAKTFREQQGPFFVHCFHGKHRGPAAAEVGRLVLDGVSRETAIAEMRQCGTAESYEGLYRTVAYGSIPSESETRALEWDFPAASPLDGIAGAMVLVSRADDHLKTLAKNGWMADPEHPDVDPRNEADKLASLFERMAELDEVVAKPDDFRRWLEEARLQSAALRDTVQGMTSGSATAETASEGYKALANSCTACHEAYRNE